MTMTNRKLVIQSSASVPEMVRLKTELEERGETGGLYGETLRYLGIMKIYEIDYNLFVSGALHITGGVPNKNNTAPDDNYTDYSINPQHYILKFKNNIHPYYFGSAKKTSKEKIDSVVFYGGHQNFQNVTIFSEKVEKADGTTTAHEEIRFESTVVAMTNCIIENFPQVVGYQTHFESSSTKLPCLVLSGCTGGFTNLELSSNSATKQVSLEKGCNITFYENLSFPGYATA